MREQIEQSFYNIFHYQSKGNLYFAPGRVNLIGEHTDYTGGYVLPFGINAGTYILTSKITNSNGIINLCSKTFGDDIVQIDTTQDLKKNNHWSDYFKAVIFVLKNNGYNINQSFDAIIIGNIPDGAGLSSSASFEMVAIIALLDANGYPIPTPGSPLMIELSLLAQQAENKFIGMQCGIMDQFASANAKESSVIKLNCNTLDFEYAPLKTDPYQILVINTNKKRRLEESKYNERRSECEKGFLLLQENGLQLNSLGELGIKEYEQISHILTDSILKRRIDHVVYENERVKIAVEKLRNNDIIKFAQLMNESGDSLRVNYEVTGYHLDTLVSIARSTKGVIASRMTGAGFGGCTVNLVNLGEFDEICGKISDEYFRETGIKPDFYRFTAGNGAMKL